jgi:ubiquinone/menaquinone biosynthesis C-methylase UbiE
MNKWDKVYEWQKIKDSIWTDLNSKYSGASPYIVRGIKKLSKSAKILDAGCGDGRNLVYLAGLGYKIFGIDISKEAIKITHNKLKALSLKTYLRVGDLYNLPYKNNFFDAIYYDFTNVHIEKPESVLADFRRVLKPGALLLFETTSKRDSLYKGKNKFFEDRFYFRFYDQKEVLELVKKYFKIKKIEPSTIWHENHGKGYAKRRKHFHKSYLITAVKK